MNITFLQPKHALVRIDSLKVGAFYATPGLSGVCQIIAPRDKNITLSHASGRELVYSVSLTTGLIWEDNPGLMVIPVSAEELRVKLTVTE